MFVTWFPRALALPVLVCAASIAAAAGTPTWKVRHGLGGVHRPDSLIPLVVTLENTGPTQESVTLDWSNESVGRRRTIELPLRSRKELVFYVGPIGNDSAVRLTVAGSDRRIRGVEEIASNPIPADVPIVALTGTHPLGLAELRNDKDRPVEVVQLRGGFPPAIPAAMRSIDVLIWVNPDAGTIEPDVMKAVAEWCEAGGHLVLGAGGVWHDFASGTLGDWTNIRATRLQSVSTFASLARLPGAGGVAPIGQMSAAALDGTAGQTWLAESWGAVAVTERRVHGAVTVLGFDLAERSLTGWQGIAALWREVAARGGIAATVASPQSGSYGFDIHSQIREQSAQEQGIHLPSFSIMGLVLVAYLLLIGPVDYFVLKKLRRLSWTWITYPSIVVLFTAGTWIVAEATKTQKPVLSHILLRDLRPISNEFADELHVSLFTSRSGLHSIRAGAPGAIPSTPSQFYDPLSFRGMQSLRGEEKLVADQGEGIIQARLGKWTSTFGVYYSRADAGLATITSDLSIDGDGLQGWLTPELGVNFGESFVLYACGKKPMIVRLGPAKDGQSLALAGLKAKEMALDYGYLEYSALELMKESARRLLRDSIEPDTDGPRDHRWEGLFNDPHPEHDWSEWLKSGGAVFVGRCAEAGGRAELVEDHVKSTGMAYYRVPLTTRSWTPACVFSQTQPAQAQPSGGL